MTISKCTTGLGLSVLLAVVSFGHSAKSQTNSRKIHFPNARTSKDGDIWLQWDRSHRLGFVEGYLRGNHDGHEKGCLSAQEVKSETSKTETSLLGMTQCLKTEKSFSGPVDIYANKITEFYQQFPSDREIPMIYVLTFLSDEDKKDFKQIHQWYLSLDAQHRQK